ncbi:MAG: hypothetical protein GY868_00130 [Deltaproteobacteria bacterium]|nr:hypothetical protein [Deltaproteobacteria bacterium]
MLNVPPGYSSLALGPAAIMVKSEYKDALLQQGINDPEGLLRSACTAPAKHSGRGAVPAIDIAGRPEERMLIRKYLRGGMLRFINHDIFLGSERPFRELDVTVAAANLGLPVPDILAAVSLSLTGPLYRVYLISRELPNCCDLPNYLGSLKSEPSDVFYRKKEAVMTCAARLIRTMHDKGFYHADLNLKNILVDCSNPQQLFIIDWDKSTRTNRITPEQRRSNLVRFCRSMNKLSLKGLPATKDDARRLLTTYWQDDTEISLCLQLLKRALSRRRLIRHLFPPK